MSRYSTRVFLRQRRSASQGNLRHRLSLASALLLLGTLVLSLVSAIGVEAAIFNPTDVTSLITAVGTPGTNIINLTAGMTYTLTTANNTTDGGNGLPVIAATSNVTINGNGATITRSGATAFRFFDIVAGGTLTLNSVTLSNGLAAGTNGTGAGSGTDGTGGAILNDGTLSITGSALTGNTTTGGNGGASGANGGTGGQADGGAINNTGTLTVANTTFSSNVATAGSGGNGTANPGAGGNGHGGAISSNSTKPTNIITSTFSGNIATGGSGGNATTALGGSPGVARGGAFNGQGTVNISDSTFTANTATAGNTGTGNAPSTAERGEGGAIYGVNGFTLTVTNSTFFKNTATGGNGTAVNGDGGDAVGGAIRIGENGSNTLNLIFVTLANNKAVGGTGTGTGTSGTGMGGALFASGTLHITGTIVASNIAPTGSNCDFGGATFNPPDVTSNNTEQYNLEFPKDATNPCGFANNTQTTDPKLATALANNGGPTQTLALQAGSGAIDKGGTSANGCPVTDQRGFTRPAGPACDIGAFEFGATASSGSGLQFYPLSKPVRLLDTRPGATAFVHPNASLTAGQTLALPGQFSFNGVTVPSTAQAIVGNATVANDKNATPAGFATLYPTGVSLPLASNLNFVPGTVRPNQFTVALGADTKFNLFSSTGGDFVIDISGYYAPVGAGGLYFHPLTAPVRELDTRAGATALVHPNATLTAGQTLTLPGNFTFAGITVPAGAKALIGNATVANDKNATPPGFATLYPDDVPLPLASNLNFVPGTVAPNAFTVALGGGDGGYDLYSSTGGDFVVDITGYLDTTAAGGLLFTPLSAPVRELDTRGGATALVHPNATLFAGQTLTLPGSFSFAGITVPVGAKALVGNATVANDKNATPAGFATLYPDNVPLPLASNLNFVPGQVAPNAFTVGIGGGGYKLYSSTGGDFVIDISGYFS